MFFWRTANAVAIFFDHVKFNHPQNSLIILCIVIGVGAALTKYLHGQDLYSLTYGMGPVIRGLVETKSTCAINPNYGWCSYATRMPLIPALGALLFHVSHRAVLFFCS